MKRSDLDGVSHPGGPWWENKALGLVYSQRHDALRFTCFFPELLSHKSVQVAELLVEDRQGAWVGSCSVNPAFAHLFKGTVANFHFDDGVYFDDVAGHSWEEKVTIAPRVWIRNNLEAMQNLYEVIVGDQAHLRDEHLPGLDLRSGIIEALVKCYKFKPAEYADARLAAEEFCRRFAYKPEFNNLLHPECSVRRHFEALRSA
jgi:hypothetical protein